MDHTHYRLTLTAEHQALRWDNERLLYPGMSLTDFFHTEAVLNHLDSSESDKIQAYLDYGDQSPLQVTLTLPNAIDRHDITFTLKFEDRRLKPRLGFEVFYTPTPEEADIMKRDTHVLYEDINLKRLLLTKDWFEFLLDQELTIRERTKFYHPLKYSVQANFGEDGVLNASIHRSIWDVESFVGCIRFSN